MVSVPTCVKCNYGFEGSLTFHLGTHSKGVICALYYKTKLCFGLLLDDLG